MKDDCCPRPSVGDVPRNRPKSKTLLSSGPVSTAARVCRTNVGGPSSTFSIYRSSFRLPYQTWTGNVCSVSGAFWSSHPTQSRFVLFTYTQPYELVTETRLNLGRYVEETSSRGTPRPTRRIQHGFPCCRQHYRHVPSRRSVRKSEAWMVIAKVVLLILWQTVPIIPSTLVSQSVLPPDVEQEDHGTDDTEPDKTEA